ncbi:hypothetical protein FN846DRAFT_69864 [Sphaerosporella brunnea]|uniref:C3H1-type domain-containing protein n=1 Tax=Sphaerosporella brunnea TaxID=1250544 RepID=A0A5J5EUV9_9PEZI|nr:hypothetical protein FN846DRAFT_69864 [Sphaerosporella brunnea]
MDPITLHYNHVLYSSDGSITPLIAANALPAKYFVVLPPNDLGSIVALQESSLCSKSIIDSAKKNDEVSTETCAYFRRREGCKRGPQCRFFHDGQNQQLRRRGTGEVTQRELARTDTAGSNVRITKGDESASSPVITCATPGRIQSRADPHRLIKTHCTYFLRFGECDYWPACKFSHDIQEGRTKVMRNSTYSWGRLGLATKKTDGPNEPHEAAEKTNDSGSEDCTSTEELITFVD